MRTRIMKSWAALGSGLVACCIGLVLTASTLQAQEAKGAARARLAESLKGRINPFNLNAAPNVLLAVNQFQCAVRNNGDTCADLNNSPINPGGFWPVGTPNAYMFNSGVNLAGRIPVNSPGNPWAGDTVGAFFFDARGTQAHGSPLTDIYSSLLPGDVDNWPVEGS